MPMDITRGICNCSKVNPFDASVQWYTYFMSL